MSDVIITLTRYNKLWTALLSAAAVAVTTALTTSPESFGTTQVIQIAIAVLAALGVYVKQNTTSQPLGKFVVQVLAVVSSFIVALEGGLTRAEVYAVLVAAMGAYLVYVTGNRPSEDIDHTHVEELANREVEVTPMATPERVIETVPISEVATRFDKEPITLDSLDAAERSES